VETKNAEVGSMSVAAHLAYLGDVTLGRGVNVGACAVTANYDGSRHHETVIQDGAFIGSGSVLVAPVNVGQDAVIGAGAVVPARRDVESEEVVAGVPARKLERKGRRRRVRKRKT